MYFVVPGRWGKCIAVMERDVSALERKRVRRTRGRYGRQGDGSDKNCRKSRLLSTIV